MAVTCNADIPSYINTYRDIRQLLPGTIQTTVSLYKPRVS